jgi:hypothetical protein
MGVRLKRMLRNTQLIEIVLLKGFEMAQERKKKELVVESNDKIELFNGAVLVSAAIIYGHKYARSTVSDKREADMKAAIEEAKKLQSLL